MQATHYLKKYKERGGTYSGEKNSDQGLSRWNREKWKDEKGNVCGSGKNKSIKKCRPTIKITEKTPVTWRELNSSEKKKVVREKKIIGMGRKSPNIKRKKATSPGRKKATSPGRKKATSPGRKKATSPGRKKATSPGRKKKKN